MEFGFELGGGGVRVSSSSSPRLHSNGFQPHPQWVRAGTCTLYLSTCVCVSVCDVCMCVCVRVCFVCVCVCLCMCFLVSMTEGR